MGAWSGWARGELLQHRDRLLVLLQPLRGLRREALRALVAGGEVAEDLLGLGVAAGLAQHLGPLGQYRRRLLFLAEQRQRLVVPLVFGVGVGLQRHRLEADGVVGGGEQGAQGGFDLVPLLAVVEDLGGLEAGLLGLLGLAVLLQGGGEAVEQRRRVATPAGALQHPRQGQGDARLLGIGVVDLGQQGDGVVVAPLGGVGSCRAGGSGRSRSRPGSVPAACRRGPAAPAAPALGIASASSAFSAPSRSPF